MRYFFASIFIALSAQMSFAGAGDSTRKHALIIAIGNYPESGGWDAISGHRDVPYIQTALERQGFAGSYIHILTDAEATKAGIETALKQLLTNIRKGDVVVIHISSHGEQIQDDNGDETDGLDEAIVPFDAIAPSKSRDFNRDTATYFRDDHFGRYCTEIRRVLGPGGDLVVFMDACHSGSGTRGRLKTRGGKPPFTESSFKPLASEKNTSDPSGLFRENSVALTQDLATYIVFSAARAEELAFEVLNDSLQSMGSLTYAISKVFEQLDAGASYRTVFAKIQSVLNSKVQGQHPVMEGNGTERELFGGRFVRQKFYAEIEQQRGPDLMEINSGTFSGLAKGAVVLLYPPGTTDPSLTPAVDTAVVENAWSYRALIRTRKKYKSRPQENWVFVHQPVYSMGQISVGFQHGFSGKQALHFSQKERENIRVILQDMPLVKFSDTAELLLARGPEKDSLLVSGNGFYFAGIPRDEKYPDNLKTLLQQYAQYKFLRDLELQDSNIRVSIDLVPVSDETPDTGAIAARYNNGIYTMAEGDLFTLRVRNRSAYDVYINILDLQPDGWMNPVLPNRSQGIYSRDLLIPAGSERIFSEYIIGIGPPYGTEIYKVFISRKPIDLENLVTIRNTEGFRGNFSVLENLVQASLESTRGSNVSVKTGNANGSVMDVVFEIVPGNHE